MGFANIHAVSFFVFHLVTYACFELVHITKSSAQNVAWCARNHPVVLVSLVLIEVRIVDAPVVDFSSVPTECRMALDAPHLVASINLGNARAARRTRFGILANHLGRFHIVFITRVLSILVCSDDLEALRTRMDGTEFALVLRGKKPATFCSWTWHNETLLFLLLGIGSTRRILGNTWT